MKLALVAPAAIVTEDGTVRLALLADRVTEAPLLEAAALNVAVQFAVPGVTIVVGVHDNDATVGLIVPEPVIVPPVPLSVRALPVGSAAEALVKLMDVVLTLEPIVIFTTATTPLAMLFAFKPVARQVYVPEPAAQLSVLPAVVAVAPAVAEMDVTSEGAYVSVH